MKSGLLRTALQIPGLQSAAIVWAPEEEEEAVAGDLESEM